MNLDIDNEVTTVNDFNLENVKPLVSNEILKTVIDEVNKIVEKISTRFNISLVM